MGVEGGELYRTGRHRIGADGRLFGLPHGFVCLCRDAVAQSLDPFLEVRPQSAVLDLFRVLL